MKFNTVKNMECGQALLVSGQCSGSRAISLACVISMRLVQHFLAAAPPINQCDRCLVPLACGLVAGRCRFTSHGVVRLGAGCVKSGNPLDIPDTHLHQVSQLLNCISLHRLAFHPHKTSESVHSFDRA